MLNSATQIALTKFDVVFPDCIGITSYEELGDEAKSFIKKIEGELGVPVSMIGTGPKIHEIIDRRK